MKKVYITTALLCFVAATGFAQKSLFGVGWNINFPKNDGYLTKTSYAGGKLEYRHFINQNFSVGAALDWTTFEQHLPKQTFEKPDGSSAVTSDFIIQSYHLPVTAIGHYYWKQTKILRPYVGVALGGNYVEQSLYYNVYVSDENNWGFVVRPELGTLIIPGGIFQGWGIIVAANYSYATNKTEIINKSDFKNVGVTLGFVFGQ
jgi:hypothetical protein